jgi:DNA-directed RNA polymerase specialized sigma24 family protein
MQLDQSLAAYQADTSKLNDLLKAITTYARRLAARIDSRIDSEDVAQQAVLDVWQHIEKGTKLTAALVVTISRRRAIDAQRQHQPITTLPHEEGIAYHQTDPVTERAAEIAYDVLGDLTADLIERQYTSQEISELTGVPASTIRKRIAKVRKMITAASAA